MLTFITSKGQLRFWPMGWTSSLQDHLNEEVVVRDFRMTTQHGAIQGKTQESKVKLYNITPF